MIICGKSIAQELYSELEPQCRGRALSIAALMIGDDAGLHAFIRLKQRAAEAIGVHFDLLEFAAGTLQKNIIKEIRRLGNEETVHGIIVELPLPLEYDAQAILDTIPINKDIDVLSTAAQSIFYENHSHLLPPSVGALKAVLNHYGIKITGKSVAVFGYGMLVGKPIAHWLTYQGSVVTVIDEHTERPPDITRQADIIVSGVGKPGLITGEMVHKGVTVIDYGYGEKNGKRCGDVDFNSVAPRAALITPVPGGMGPIVIASMFQNLLELKLKLPA